MANKEQILTITWCYDDYIMVTDREYCQNSQDRWAEIIDRIELEKLGGIDIHESVRNTIELLDSEFEDD